MRMHFWTKTNITCILPKYSDVAQSKEQLIPCEPLSHAQAERASKDLIKKSQTTRKFQELQKKAKLYSKINTLLFDAVPILIVMLLISALTFVICGHINDFSPTKIINGVICVALLIIMCVTIYAVYRTNNTCKKTQFTNIQTNIKPISEIPTNEQSVTLFIP